MKSDHVLLVDYWRVGYRRYQLHIIVPEYCCCVMFAVCATIQARDLCNVQASASKQIDLQLGKQLR